MRREILSAYVFVKPAGFIFGMSYECDFKLNLLNLYDGWYIIYHVRLENVD